MSNVDPFRLKFFDESGVSLYDCNKRYGHSPVNSGCVELGRHLKSPNITLNFLAGLEGVLYANTLVQYVRISKLFRRSNESDAN